MRALIRLSVCVGVFVLPLRAAVAQSQTPKDLLELRKDRSVTVQPAIKPSTGNNCAAFGPGFKRLEGSDTCVKVGGAIGVGTGFSR